MGVRVGVACGPGGAGWSRAADPQGWDSLWMRQVCLGWDWVFGEAREGGTGYGTCRGGVGLGVGLALGRAVVYNLDPSHPNRSGSYEV